MRDIGNGGSDEGERDDSGRKNEREREMEREGRREGAISLGGIEGCPGQEKAQLSDSCLVRDP